MFQNKSVNLFPSKSERFDQSDPLLPYKSGSCLFYVSKVSFVHLFLPELLLIFLCLILWRFRIQVQTCGFRLEKMGTCQVSPPCKTIKLSGHGRREWNPVSFCLVVTHFHRHPRLHLNIFIGGWRRLMLLQIDLILNVEIG